MFPNRSATPPRTPDLDATSVVAELPELDSFPSDLPPWKKAELDFGISVIGNVRGSHILDYACSDAAWSTATLASNGAIVSGADICASSLLQARANFPDLSFHLVTSGRISVRDATFDAAFCSGLYFTTAGGRNDPFAIAQREIARVTKPGGIYVYLLVNPDWLQAYSTGFSATPKGDAPTASAMRRLLEDSGFRVDKISEAPPHPGLNAEYGIPPELQIPRIIALRSIRV